MVSAVWFAPEHRATATAVAYMGGNLGSMIGFVFGTVRVFRREFTLEDGIGSHACSLEAIACV